MNKYEEAGYKDQQEYLDYLNKLKLVTLGTLSILIELGEVDACRANTKLIEQIQTLIDLES
jgi:hypothetical protein